MLWNEIFNEPSKNDGFQNTDSDYYDEEILVVPENLKPPVNDIFKDELDILHLDEEYIYTYSDIALPNWLSDALKLKICNPYERISEKIIKKKIYKNIRESNNIKFRKLLVSRNLRSGVIITYGLPKFLEIIESDETRAFISVYPINRYGDIFLNDNSFSTDIYKLVKHQKFLTQEEFLERIIRYYNNELNKKFPEPGNYIF